MNSSRDAEKQMRRERTVRKVDSESRRFAAGINWYPGHMKKTREMMQENLKLVDAVIEVIDARTRDLV